MFRYRVILLVYRIMYTSFATNWLNYKIDLIYSKNNKSNMELPFELDKRHKSHTKSGWKTRGLITDEFEEIYKQYIYSTNCDLCGTEYKSRRDRCMEHSHDTGEFRNICCQICNARKSDVKIRSDNTSGHKYISKEKDPRYKQGFRWIFMVQINGKRKTIKKLVNLEKLIKISDEWFKDNPNYYT